MCLDSIKKFKVNQDFGFVLFSRNGKRLIPLYRQETYRNKFGSEFVPIDVWQHDKTKIDESKFIQTESGRYYPAGFHIYLNENDAHKDLQDDDCSTNLEVRIVSFKNIIATGYEQGWKVIVAKSRLVHRRNYNVPSNSNK